MVRAGADDDGDIRERMGAARAHHKRGMRGTSPATGSLIQASARP
jgi:hypothetical protein